MARAWRQIAALEGQLRQSKAQAAAAEGVAEEGVGQSVSELRGYSADLAGARAAPVGTPQQPAHPTADRTGVLPSVNLKVKGRGVHVSDSFLTEMFCFLGQL